MASTTAVISNARTEFTMRPVSMIALLLALGAWVPRHAAAAEKTTKSATSTKTASTHAKAKKVSAHGTSGSSTTHSTAHKGHSSKGHTSKGHSSKGHKTAPSKPAHLPMDKARATEIQTALIKSGYLSGEATGTWDAQSMAAMQKLQSDQGWQTKIVPDSRALIKLGLGPTAPSAPNN